MKISKVLIVYGGLWGLYSLIELSLILWNYPVFGATSPLESALIVFYYLLRLSTIVALVGSVSLLLTKANEKKTILASMVGFALSIVMELIVIFSSQSTDYVIIAALVALVHVVALAILTGRYRKA